MARTLVVALALIAAAGCGALPDIAVGVCGNHIVEAGEDCDSAEPNCVPAGQPDQCRRRCSAFPDSTCPPGAICDGSGACVAGAGACGNHVVEAGEDCDGAVGCIAPTEPGACHMSCSAFAGGHCPPSQICDGHGACVAAPDRCGNGFVDAGEECDGTPGCIDAGGPDACKLACASHPGGHCPAGSICDAHGACVAAAALCGNLVVESGEDCDGSVGCGAPGSPAACRFSCTGGLACAHGYVCGRDQVCRQPTGRFRLGTPFGRGDEAFALADLDGDGISDVVARGPHQTTLYRNDGSGALSLWASGATPPRPIDQPVVHPAKASPRPSPALALTRDGDTRLMVALTPTGVDLFRLFTPAGATTATIQPMVTPTLRLGYSAHDYEFVGLVTYLQTSWPYALSWATFFRQQRGGKEFVRLSSPNTSGGSNDTEFDVAQSCGVSGSSWRMRALGRGSELELVIVIDNRWVCIGEGVLGYWGAAQLTWHTVDAVDAVAQLAASGWWQGMKGSDPRVGQATMVDVNGDGRLDIGCWHSATNGAEQVGGFVYWMRNADGSWPALPVITEDGLRPPVSDADPLGIADLDGDKRDDLMFGGELFRSTPPPTKAYKDYYDFRSRYAYPTVRASDKVALALGDVSGDRRTDLVQVFSTRPDVSVCRQAGAGTFPALGCIDEPSGLASIAGLTLTDVSGDGRLDILTFGRGTPAWGGLSTLSVILGSDTAIDAPAAILLPAYRSTIVGAASGEPVGAGASSVVVVTDEDGRYSLAKSHGSSQGGVSFGWDGGNLSDIHVQDYNGDGALDVAMLGINVTTQHGPRLDTTVGVGIIGDDQTSRFLELPGEPYPLVFSTYGSGQQIGWYAPVQYSDYQWTQTGLSGSQWSAKVQDVDGDGKPEIVLFDPDCDLYVGHWVHQTLVPQRIGERPAGYHCDDVFFLDVAPQDGVPDAFYEVRSGDEPTTHLLLSRARADGTFDAVHAVLDPPVAVSGGAATALPAGSKWVGSADLDGDGIDDLVVWTPDGALIAFADVVRR